MNTAKEISAVITWAADAAREAVELARFHAEPVDLEGEGGLGLWQTFQETFDAAAQEEAGIRELAIAAYLATFEETVKAAQAVLVEAGVANVVR